MRTSIKLNVSAQYFFQRLVDTRLYDIYTATDHWLTPDQLLGFAYLTEDGSGEACQVKITQLLPGLSYHYQSKKAAEVINTAYELEPLAKNQVRVVFDQQVRAKNPLQAVKNKVTGVLLDHLRASNLKRVLKQLEVGY
ncbi:hypothetical protein LPAF129_02330 [Ligilactobacillus pabuli]|uniref:Uncharacterized protein n=1 Tax=Ligilactobacillus pabuli TaxID=2886039 RepID=A0ABQ5JFB6_9LACO|nr:DUF3284 domain-containing protein [Ligilactobacillus pabuli]GKS80548.1 hypothetical protein LPAF129_02330 [Ligilactobacillus pabuli]HIW89356.1 DUF3284 domain-containing protein [Candidatus Ligilactobacillus excrementipullorum]